MKLRLMAEDQDFLTKRDEDVSLQQIPNGSNLSNSLLAQSLLSNKVRKKKPEGLHHPRAVFFLILWYIFSAVTLFLNKYILSYRKTDPYLLCAVQMCITMLCGLFQLRFPLGTYKPCPGQRKPPDFIKNMVMIGILQMGTILFGLVALYFVAVSFAETVKSSAPIFTVLIARIVMGEPTSSYVIASLFPVMFGLFLCSATELSFSLYGFICAMLTNLCECLQSVLSKRVLSDKNYIYNPAQLQFFPNLFAVLLQFPLLLFFFIRNPSVFVIDADVLYSLLIDGISFHGQTITAYVLMTYISPVTYSVANTTKRAFMIWFSILIFGNPITFYSGLGTLVVIGGVFMYQKAKNIDERRRLQFSITEDTFRDIR